MKFTKEEGILADRLMDTMYEIKRLPKSSKNRLEVLIEILLSQTFERKKYSTEWKRMVS